MYPVKQKPLVERLAVFSLLGPIDKHCGPDRCKNPVDSSESTDQRSYYRPGVATNLRNFSGRGVHIANNLAKGLFVAPTRRITSTWR